MKRYLSVLTLIVLLSCKDKSCLEQPPSYFFALTNTDGSNRIDESNHNDLQIVYKLPSGKDSTVSSVISIKDKTYNYIFNISPLVDYPTSNERVYTIRLKDKRLSYFQLKSAFQKIHKCNGYSFLSGIDSDVKHYSVSERNNVHVFEVPD